jgi:hypothetical protein
MNPWPFVYGAYAFAVGGTLVLTAWSWIAMRGAEAEAARLSARA